MEVDVRSNAAKAGRERRRAGRVRQQFLRCNLGRIVDVSGSGMRVRRVWSKRIGSVMRIAIKGHALGGPLVGCVMWSRRAGLFTHEIGVQFVDPHPVVVHELATIVGCAGLRRLRPESNPQASRIV